MLLGSDILEVGVGLFFLYFLGSVIASHANELFAGLLKQRSKQLEVAIKELVADPKFAQLLLTNPLILSLGSKGVRSFNKSDQTLNATNPKTYFTVQNEVYSPPKNGKSKTAFPSYIPSSLFAKALLNEIYSLGLNPPDATQIVKPSPASAEQIVMALNWLKSNGPSPELRNLGSSLLMLISGAEKDYQRIVGSIENWYDQKMERVSGAYKRWTQGWILLWALLIALILNLDTGSVVQALWSNGALRHSIANQAVNTTSMITPGATSGISQTVVSSNPLSIDQTRELLQNQAEAGLPIGWSPYIKNINDPLSWLSKIVGIIISMLAISLGAPFWFDLLSKLSNLRASGLQPASTTPTAPQPPAPPPVQTSIPASSGQTTQTKTNLPPK